MEILELYKELGKGGICITLCWIPGHACISGNYLANHEAKEATDLNVISVITLERFLFIFVNLNYYCSYYSVLSHFFPSESNILFPNLSFFSARSSCSLAFILHSSLLAIFFSDSLSASVQPSKFHLKVFFN